MDRQTITHIKRKFPGLFGLVVKVPFLARLASELDRVRYWYCKFRKKPYFGTVALAGQTRHEAKFYMTQAIGSELTKKGGHRFRLLEIGSWAGDSAVLWANAIKSANSEGMIVCVDAWEPYIREEHELVNASPIIMNRALKKGNIFDLFLYNIKMSGHLDMIYPVKGGSEEVLPILEKESFDMVYVDGDHTYSGTMKDLINAAKLVADQGILCGDDFELSIDQIDRDHAQKNKEINIVTDPKTRQAYHPGVCLALFEFFGISIPSYNGFWIMRKCAGRWEQVILHPLVEESERV